MSNPPWYGWRPFQAPLIPKSPETTENTEDTVETGNTTENTTTDSWIALEEEDLSDEGGDEGEVSDLDEAGGNFSDNEVFELY